MRQLGPSPFHQHQSHPMAPKGRRKYVTQHHFEFWQDEMSIQLIVQEVPEQPKNLRINSQQSRSLQLTWSQPFAGNSPIEEYHIYYKQISGESIGNG